LYEYGGKAMTRGILIAGNESPLTAAIAAETARRVEQYAEALIPNRLSDSPPSAGEGNLLERGNLISLSWNPGSPVSARALVLGVENRIDHIDEAILVCVPPSIRKAPASLAPADIEILVNDHIKGWFFLVRELAAVFKARQSGTLALVLSDIEPVSGRNDLSDLAGPPVAAVFRAFAQGLLNVSFSEPYQVLGFSASETGEDAAFASFILKTIEEANKKDSGKWHRFGKLSLFGR
jgi:hypothetical protein